GRQRCAAPRRATRAYAGVSVSPPQRRGSRRGRRGARSDPGTVRPHRPGVGIGRAAGHRVITRSGAPGVRVSGRCAPRMWAARAYPCCVPSTTAPAAHVPADAQRRWTPGWPLRPGPTLGVLQHGPADPTVRTGAGVWWRGLRTPEGAATLRVEFAGGDVRAAAWGAGAAWAVAQVPALLGAEDATRSFEPGHHRVVAELARRFAHLRLARTGMVWDALVPAIIEQKVTGSEAFAGYRRLVRGHGDRAPGPGGDLVLWVPPAPES